MSEGKIATLDILVQNSHIVMEKTWTLDSGSGVTIFVQLSLSSIICIMSFVNNTTHRAVISSVRLNHVKLPTFGHFDVIIHPNAAYVLLWFPMGGRTRLSSMWKGNGGKGRQ